MKVLGILCSYRKGGNSEILLRGCIASSQDCGATAELVTLFDKNLKPCDGCGSCTKSGKCHIKDDMQDIYVKLLEADAIIWGTPVYFHSVPAQAKIVVDRCYALIIGNKLSDKIGGVISVASSMGHLGVTNVFNTFFKAHNMHSLDPVCGYAREKGDILKDRYAIQAANELGRAVVTMAKAGLRYPQEYKMPLHRLVKKKYKVSACPAEGRFDI